MDRDNESFKELKKEPKISWADVHYNQIQTMCRLRYENLETFRKGVTALEISLYGHIDDLYLRDIKVLDFKRKVVEGESSVEEADLFYYDEKAKVLVSLAVRVHKNIQLIRESIIDSYFVKEVVSYLLDGIGQNVFLTGPPGIGKSWTAIRLALEVVKNTNQKFDVETHVCFTPKDFLKIYNNPELSPPGSVIILDEIGVNFGARDALSKANKIFAKLLQVMRRRSLLIIFTSPDLSFIDSSGRKLLHFWLEGTKLMRQQGITTFKPHTVQLIQSTGKILYPFPVYNDKKLSRLTFDKIPKAVGTKYESMARKYKDKLGLQIAGDLVDAGEGNRMMFDKFCQLRSEGLSMKKIYEEHIPMSPKTATKLENKRKTLLYGEH